MGVVVDVVVVLVEVVDVVVVVVVDGSVTGGTLVLVVVVDVLLVVVLLGGMAGALPIAAVYKPPADTAVQVVSPSTLVGTSRLFAGHGSGEVQVPQ